MNLSAVKSWLFPALGGAIVGLALGPVAAMGIPIALGIILFARAQAWKVFGIGMLIVLFPFGLIFPAGLALFGAGSGVGDGSSGGGGDDSFLGDVGDLFDVPGFDEDVPGTGMSNTPPMPDNNGNIVVQPVGWDGEWL